jgi:hypothetical protein
MSASVGGPKQTLLFIVFRLQVEMLATTIFSDCRRLLGFSQIKILYDFVSIYM